MIFFTSWEQNFQSQNFLWSFCWYVRKKWDFDVGYGLHFSFYLFYTLCKIFTTIGAVLRKILGFLTWQVFNFLTFSIKMESAIFSLQNMQFTPNLSTIKKLMIGTNLGVEKTGHDLTKFFLRDMPYSKQFWLILSQFIKTSSLFFEIVLIF